MTKKKRIFGELAVLFLMLELVLQFLNSDKYLQVSGMYLPLALSILCACVQFFFDNITLTGRNAPVIVLIACLLVSALNNLQQVQRGYLLSYLLLLVLVFLFFTIWLTRRQTEWLIFAYALSGVLIAALMILAGRQYYNNDSSRITIQLGGPLIDPNYLGAYLLGPCLLWLRYLLRPGKPGRRIACAACTALCLVGIMLTGSRGAFLALALGLVVFGWKTCRKMKITLSRRGWTLLAAAVLAVLLLALLLVPQQIVRLLNVFNWGDASNSRRFSLWGQAIQTIFRSPIGGQGICDTALLIERVTGKADPSHCVYLELWLHLGIFGLVALFFIVFPQLINKRSPMAAAVCVVTLVSGIFISSEMTVFFWMNILAAELLCRMDGTGSVPGKDRPRNARAAGRKQIG